MQNTRLNENYGKAVKYFTAETALTEGEIINIAARDNEINVPAEELDVSELGDVLARHKADILQQRKFRAMNAQRNAGVVAAEAIENVAAGTYLTESQLAHLVDKNKRLDLASINESKLIDLAIASLQDYQNKLDGGINEGWITVSAVSGLNESKSRFRNSRNSKRGLNEGWITVGDSKGLNEGWITVGDSKDLNEGWITVGDSKDLNEGWNGVGTTERELNESPKRFRNSRKEQGLNEGKTTDILTQSLNERLAQNSNHNLDLSKANRFVIPNHMV